MVQMLGAILMAGGAAWLGFGAALSLRERGRALENMAHGLAMLARGLEMDEPPLPRLMERLIPRSRGPAKELFQGCAKALDRLEEEEFSHAWQRLCAGQNDIGEDGQQALIPLGGLLGRSTCLLFIYSNRQK